MKNIIMKKLIKKINRKLKRTWNCILIFLLITGCTSQKDCSDYKKQLESCEIEHSDCLEEKDRMNMEILVLKNTKEILIEKVDNLENQLELCDTMLLLQTKQCKDSIEFLNERIKIYKNTIANYSNLNNKLKDSVEYWQNEFIDSTNLLKSQILEQCFIIEYFSLKLDQALFFIVDTFSIDNTKFFIIERQPDVFDTVKIYHSESTYWIVNYVLKNDTITTFRNDFIDYQNSQDHAVLIINAEGTFCQDAYPILAVNVNDTFYCRIVIDQLTSIVHILKSYDDIENISLEFINDKADSTCDRNVTINSVALNKYEMDSIDVILPAVVEGGKIRMRHNGAKIIIKP